jgi:hypothetical protein
MSSMPSLKKDVFSLAIANAVDCCLEFFMPMVVARELSSEEFGFYGHECRQDTDIAPFMVESQVRYA